MTTKGPEAAKTKRILVPELAQRPWKPSAQSGLQAGGVRGRLSLIASTLGISAVSASYGSSGEPRQGQRANAQAALAEMAVLEEQYFLNNKRYTGHLGSKGLGVDSTMTAGERYTLRVELPAQACPAGYCYILSAVPQGEQAGDECGTLTLSSDGTKLPAGCW